MKFKVFLMLDLLAAYGLFSIHVLIYLNAQMQFSLRCQLSLIFCERYACSINPLTFLLS